MERGEGDLHLHHGPCSPRDPDAIGPQTPNPAHQRDVHGLHGYNRPVGHGDADVGLRQGGRIVDAISDHDHAMAFGSQLPDTAGRVFRIACPSGLATAAAVTT